jgi:peptide subunit release factor 1 (eRF1)
VLDALAEGRVHTLLLDAARELEGSATGDGRLYPAGVVPPGVSPDELRTEPHLAERMAERALETGATLVAVTGAAAETLAEHDGVAAILRW